MTTFPDNIYSGLTALTSALSSQSPVRLCRTFNFTGGGSQTKSAVVPAGAQNLNAVCYIIQDGSAATSDTITVSAGGTNLISFTGIGSASGLVEITTTSLGAKSVIASACSQLSLTAETTIDATLVSVDTATQYQVSLTFNLARSIS